MAIESSLKNMVLSLGTICLVSSALLAGAYALTKAPIDAANAAKTTDAIKHVLPEFDGEPELSTVEVAGKEYTYYAVSKDGQVSGYAINAAASGFGGPVALMVGVTSEGIVYNTTVLSHNETPGLGAKCTEEFFAAQFRNLDPSATNLAVKKDGGDIDAITASTITSRAYIEAVKTALNVYEALQGHEVDMASGASVSGSDWQEATETEQPAETVNE